MDDERTAGQDESGADSQHESGADSQHEDRGSWQHEGRGSWQHETHVMGQRGYSKDEVLKITLEVNEGEAQRQKSYTKADENRLQGEIGSNSEKGESGNEAKQ